jgi:hypothetical protein
LLVYLGLLYESFALHYVFSLSNDSLRFATISPITIMPFAIFAGFSWEWIIVIFKRIGDAIVIKNRSEDYIDLIRKDEGEKAFSEESKEQAKMEQKTRDFFRYRNIQRLLYVTIPMLFIFMIVSFIPVGRDMAILYPLESVLLNIVISAFIWFAAFVIKNQDFRFDFAQVCNK